MNQGALLGRVQVCGEGTVSRGEGDGARTLGATDSRGARWRQLERAAAKTGLHWPASRALDARETLSDTPGVVLSRG